ncbi:hypothetical protein GCM10009801_81760 [Streptomyces albiaxialis]|uniref:Uncharacterized protein n=1 Tax=Streptomyces albiaxialis TaxID=329523 RepID=A0ABN2X6G5_9ACTN
MTESAEDSTAAIVQRAEKLNQSRMEAIRPLADMLARRTKLREELEATDAEYGRLYVEAERNGWTPDELNNMGAEAPTRRPRGRPKKRSAPRSGASKGETPKASPSPGSAPVPGGSAASPPAAPAPRVNPDGEPSGAHT